MARVGGGSVHPGSDFLSTCISLIDDPSLTLCAGKIAVHRGAARISIGSNKPVEKHVECFDPWRRKSHGSEHPAQPETVL